MPAVARSTAAPQLLRHAFGAEGLMIRPGALAEPVREVTVASTLQRMLLDIQAVSGDVEWLPGGSAVPSIVIADVSLGGAVVSRRQAV